MKVREALQLAAAHLAGNRLTDAEALYRQVLAASPRNFTAAVGLAKVGLLSGHAGESAEILRGVVADRPDDVDARAALAEALHRSGQVAQAMTLFRNMIETDPGCFAAISRYGNALIAARDYVRAEPVLRRAVELSPNPFKEHLRLGLLFCHWGRPREAIPILEHAATLCPDDPVEHMELGVAFMFADDFAQGVREMEWRLKLPDPPEPGGPYPRWDGRVEPGKTLLVVCEEGQGDNIQFASFLGELTDSGMNVVFRVRPELRSLFRSLQGVRLVGEEEEVPHVDAWQPLLSLPYTLGLNGDRLRRQTPYLAADPEKVAAFARRLAETGDNGGGVMRIGLAWAGNPLHPNDANRSMPLSTLARPLASIPDVEFHSLHVAPEAQQAIETSGLPVRFHGEHLRDFADTAALISNLSLVITIDTSVAHIAGALAKPVWILLPYKPDSRWLLHPRDTLFYPTATLFRQPRARDWASVVEEVRQALTRLPRARDRA